ncbi:DUF7948 domain-containing protein [Dyadobacter sandarakinus]|nr:gliding motility-associated C-terminal domain-containing protein [Dyadobacter sandarakinus]
MLLLIIVLLWFPGKLLATGMFFIQNQGQWEREVLFRTEIPGGFLFLKQKSIVYVMYDAAAVAARHAGKSHTEALARHADPPETIGAHGVEMFFENAAANAAVVPSKALPTSYSYFMGSDESKWARNAGAYQEVRYKGIYPGIDLRVYTHQFTLKYEFIVSPGADPARISLAYQGAEQLSLNENGQIVVKTSVGQFREAEPFTFQEVNGGKKPVSSKFALAGSNTVRFALESYDHTCELTIDPELIFSTYSGSTADNWGHTATYDAAGNLYSGGTVFGLGFPATQGAFQVRFGGLVDVAILKFSPDGSQLLYATYLGGQDTDLPTSLIVNSKNELLILGTTGSDNFPVRSDAFQKTFGKGVRTRPISGLDLTNGSDIFISKLSADGRQLAASTYLGGDMNDGVSQTSFFTIHNYGDPFRGEIVVDAADNVLIASSTNSGNFPLKNPGQTRLGGYQDGIVSKLDPALSTLLWSTYIGAEKEETAFGLKVLPNGDVYVTGSTTSIALPGTKGAYQPALKGSEDAYIAKFSGDKLVKTTYLGTDSQDAGYLLDLDPAGNVCIYGLTNGSYPVSEGVYSNAKSGQFVHALDASLTTSVFSTIIGSGRGTPDISPTAFLVSECGNIYLAGWGGSVNSQTNNNPLSSTSNLPVTEDAMQKVTNGNNFYIAILEQGARSLLYATFFGSSSRNNEVEGDHVDGGTSRFDKNGTIYHATCACGGSNFPVTPQAWSKTNKSENCNNAAFKIDIDRLRADFDVYAGETKDVTTGCAPLALSFANTSEGGIDYIWQVNGNTISREEDGPEYVFNQPGEYIIKLTAYNQLSCKRMDVAEKKVTVVTLNTTVMPDTTVCENTTLQLRAGGGTSYQWTPAQGLSNAASASPSVTVQQTTDFSVVISNAAGCKVTRTVKVVVNKKTDFAGMPDTEVCVGATVTLTVAGDAGQYVWQAADGLEQTTGNSVTVKPEKTTVYTVQGIYADGCKPVRQIRVTVDRSYQPELSIIQSGGACNEAFLYTMSDPAGKGVRYVWDLGNGVGQVGQTVTNYQYGTEGEYTVTVTAYNAAGCALTASKMIRAAPAFTLSNVITPNGDGKNDFFVVPVPGSNFEVFNRWGKSVFKAADYRNDWGKGIGNGTYFYVVDTPQGTHCKGWVEVLE